MEYFWKNRKFVSCGFEQINRMAGHFK